MASTPTMGRPTVGGRPGDSPEEITKRRLYWSMALAVLVLVAVGLAMRNRNRVTTYTPAETSVIAPVMTEPAMTAPALTEPAVTPGINNPGAPVSP